MVGNENIQENTNQNTIDFLNILNTLSDNFETFSSMEGFQFDEFIKNYINQIIETIENEEHPVQVIDEPGEYAQEFNYTNTVYYKCLDMILDESNLDEFKDYAKSLIADQSKSFETEAYNISSSGRGPDMLFFHRADYILEPHISLQNILVTLNNGNIIKNISSDNRELNWVNDLYTTIDKDLLYGSRVDLSYQLDIKNISNYDNTGQISFICYISDYVSLDDIYFYGKKADGSIMQFNYDNIEYYDLFSREFKEQNYNILHSNLNLFSPEVFENIPKHKAFIVRLNVENEPDFTFTKDDDIMVQFRVSTLLSYRADTDYNCDFEIFNYSNKSNRRLINATAGSFLSNNKTIIDTDSDTAKSNRGVIVVPFGENKCLNSIYISLGLLISLLIVLVIKVYVKRK